MLPHQHKASVCTLHLQNLPWTWISSPMDSKPLFISRGEWSKAAQSLNTEWNVLCHRINYYSWERKWELAMNTLLLLIWRLKNKLTNIWKPFLSYSECPLLLMIKNSNHIWRTKVNPIHLQIRKYFSQLSQEVVRNSDGCLEDVLPQIQMSRHLLVLWSVLFGKGCQDSQEFPTPLLLLHC